VLLACDGSARAQYVGQPTVFNGPIPGAPAPAGAQGESTLTSPGLAWVLTPSLALSETYTDNVNLAPSSQARSDLVTSISPSLNIVGQSAHVNLAFTYDPQLLLFALGTSSPVVQQQLLGTGKVEIVPHEVFIDGSASISQAYVSTAGAFAPTNVTTNNNLQTVEAVNFSPYIDHHLGSYADTETRYRFSMVSTGAAGIGDQTSNQLISTIKGGDYFGLLGLTLTSSYTKTGGLSTTTGTVGNASSVDELERLDIVYPVYDRVSATSSIGYEKIKDPTLTMQPSGVLWDIGLRYDPSPFVSVSLSYGHHPIGTDFAFNARYDVSAQLHLNASYSQTVQTTQSLIAGNLNGLVVGPGGVLINPKTGLPATPGQPFGPGVVPFSLTNGSFLDKRFELDATATRGRNTYSVTVYDDRQSDQVGQSNTQAMGGTFGWIRQLWPNLTSNVNASYARIGYLDGSGRTDNYYAASASLAYTLSRTVNAQLSFSRSDRRSNVTQNNLVDDLVTLSVQKQF
jgi:uncharacterized protein (PEP-CTERM system associated)